MSKGLRSWVQANWVDIANPKKGGGFPKCGRSGGEKRRNYPKCVPAAKARSMSASQRAAAVSRKKKAADPNAQGEVVECKVENIKLDFTKVTKEKDGRVKDSPSKVQGSSSEETREVPGSQEKSK